MTDNQPLTKNFSLYEMLLSQQAARFSFDEQYQPSEKEIENLRLLCKHILQPLRDELKISVNVSSGYRCQRLNAMIGGAMRSQHLTGQAADIVCFKTGNENLLKKIVQLELPFDQVINEFNYRWVHVSYDLSRNRKQILEAYKNNLGQTKYREIV
ncbi:MAG: D-Ala-D-Ala carboxypeptidase family metallohydrolase [Bacteroidota bacterium]